MKKILSLVAVFSLLAAATHAQLADSLKAMMIRDWTRAKGYTQEYLNAMPADKYNYRPNDSVRTFAQQYLHLADGNFGLSSIASGLPVPRRGLEKMQHQTKDSVMAVVNASYDFVIEGLKQTDPASFLDQAKMGNFSSTKLAWFMKVFEHQTHHRGQTTQYIRQLGLKPPPERLF